jgi:predicted RecB family nuclease
VIEKPYLDNWRHRIGREDADKVLRNAAEFGTKLHGAARRESVEAEIEPYAAAVRTFLDKHVLEVLGTEVELVNPDLRFGGTLDLYCQLKDGTYAVVDYKTTAQLTREHGLQLAAYALLCRKHDLRVNRRLAVRIKKNRPGEFYVRQFEDHREDVQAFLGLLEFWLWRHRAAVRRAS